MRPSHRTLDAWRLILEAHQRLTAEMDVSLRKQHGLRLDWYDVLYQLSAAEGRMRMHELAAATLFSRTDTTRIVDRMERAGLVHRERAAEDGRGVYAVMSSDGWALFRKAAVTHMDDIQSRFGAYIPDEEAATMVRALGRVLAAAED